MFFLDISAVEYETTLLFHNIGYQSLSDTVTHYGKNGDFSCGTAEVNLQDYIYFNL